MSGLDEIKEQLSVVVANVKMIQESRDTVDTKITQLRSENVTAIYYNIAQNISLNIQNTIDAINAYGNLLDKLTRLEQLRSSIACQIDSYRNEITTRLNKNSSALSCNVVKNYTPQTNYNINNLVTGINSFSGIQKALDNFS